MLVYFEVCEFSDLCSFLVVVVTFNCDLSELGYSLVHLNHKSLNSYHTLSLPHLYAISINVSLPLKQTASDAHLPLPSEPGFSLVLTPGRPLSVVHQCNFSPTLSTHE